MSSTKVKTTYNVQGSYGSTETRILYCHHHNSTDNVIFYDENGDIAIMFFNEWITGNDLWDAMNRLWYPYKGKWGQSELKDNVEYYIEEPHNSNASSNEKCVSVEENQYKVALIAELINIYEHPEDSNKEWKDAIISIARDKGYGN